MNIQEVQALTDDEIRCKIGELQGWKRDVTTEAEFNESRVRNIWVDPKGKRFIYGLNYPPNYPADLNACSSFEATFISDYHQAVKYSWNLLRAIRLEVSEDADDLNLDYCWHIAHAPARARCEALILTLTQP